MTETDIVNKNCFISNNKKKARNNVKFVVMDMYKPYVSLVKKCFPKANIIFDKFHIINSISRALNKTRIKVISANKEVYNKFNI